LVIETTRGFGTARLIVIKRCYLFCRPPRLIVIPVTGYQKSSLPASLPENRIHNSAEYNLVQ
jgi:hypothetical protein